MKRLFSVGLLLLLLCEVTPAYAQTASSSDEIQPYQPASRVGVPEANSPLKCFDYYRFGSVQADLQPNVAQTVTGTELTFSGDVVNDNEYPLLDGTLYVRIFKQDEAVLQGGDGNPVVDQFVIKEGMTIKGKSSVPVSYTWQVPTHLEGGEYYAAYFFETSDRYNLLGLPFTDDVVGNRAFFTITSSSSETVTALSKSATTLNDENHTFVAFPPHFPASDTVVIKTMLTNSSDHVKTLPLQWNQFAWDSVSADNLRYTKTEVVMLQPGETKTVSYEVQPQPESVIYVVGIAEDNDVKSFINVRFVRDGIEETRINFPGLTTFPIAKDQTATLFACAHAVNTPLIPGNTLTLSLKDKDGKVIHEYHYEGDLSAAMGGFGETFTAAEDINYAVLTATLEHNGVVIDEVSQTYDCAAIDKTTCLPDAVQHSVLDFLETHLLVLLAGIVILVFVIGAFLWYRRRHKEPVNDIPMTTPIAILFFGLVSLLSFSPLTVQAEKSTVVSGWASAWNADIQQDVHMDFDASYNITYHADVINADTGAPINDGDTVPMGTKVKFVPKARGFNQLTDDIQWTFNGNVWGTPYGYWGNAPGCLAADRVDDGGVHDSLGQAMWVYTPMMVNRNQEVITPSGVSLTDLGGGVYQTASGGTLHVNFLFPQSTGYFAFYYKRPSQPGCHVANDANKSIVVQDANINFDITVVAPNSPPNPPTIGGPTSGIEGASQSYTFTAADPDGDQVKYAIDWNKDGTEDIWTPAAGFVNSGATSNASRSWTAGSYTFQAKTRDINGSDSAWASYTVTISPPPPPTADLKINGSDGPVNVVKNTNLILTWSSANAASCTKWGGTWGSGQTIATSGWATTVVTVSGTYMINCGGTVDQVTVNVVNRAPNTPTITHPTGNANYNTNTTFTIRGSDPDGDSVFYEIDWDNDGNFDDTTSPLVPSNTAVQKIKAFQTTGPVTVKARTVDSAGLRSGWGQVQIIVNPPPAPEVTLEAAINGGSFNTGNQTVNPSDSVSLRWSATDATSCSGTGAGFNTGGSVSGIDAVTTPAPNSATTFTATCNGAGGTGNKSLTITTRQRPNFNQPIVNFQTSPDWDTTTGNYSYVDVTFNTTNNGGSDTTANADYKFEADRTESGYDYITTGSMGLLTVNQTFSKTERIPGPIHFGDLPIRITADHTNQVTETNEGDNVLTTTLRIPPPNPDLNITADKEQLREGETTTIRWTSRIVMPRFFTQYTYQMNCRIFGPNIDINTQSNVAGSTETAPITAKSVFTYQCTEGFTGTVFTDTVTVETTGKMEET